MADGLVGKLKGGLLWMRIGGLICLLPVLLRLVSINLLLRWFTPKEIPGQPNSKQRRKILSYTEAIWKLNFSIFRPSCLKRSLILYYFLTRSGYPVQLNLGIRKDDRQEGEATVLSGHGWLSLNGKAYLEQNEPEKTFTLIYSFPSCPAGI